LKHKYKIKEKIKDVFYKKVIISVEYSFENFYLIRIAHFEKHDSFDLKYCLTEKKHPFWNVFFESTESLKLQNLDYQIIDY
jgi:hypothetical protein